MSLLCFSYVLCLLFICILFFLLIFIFSVYCFFVFVFFFFFFFNQKTAYEMRISDWSSDVCSSDLLARRVGRAVGRIIVDDNRFPDSPRKRCIEPGNERRDVRGLVEGRDDDRQLDALCGHASPASTASPIAVVESVPPRSGVRAPPAIAAATAASIRSAGSCMSSEWRSSIAADRIAAHGLALPCPAISGALPWIGSYRPHAPAHSRSAAEGRIPIEPTHMLARSDRMSPNILPVTQIGRAPVRT